MHDDSSEHNFMDNDVLEAKFRPVRARALRFRPRALSEIIDMADYLGIDAVTQVACRAHRAAPIGSVPCPI